MASSPGRAAPIDGRSPRVTWGIWLRARALALGFALLAAPVAVAATLGSLAWPGTPFPGFFVMPNGLVPAVGSYGWTGWQHDVPLLHEIEAVDGLPVVGSRTVYEAASSRPVGTALTYRFHGEAGAIERVVPTMRFSWSDYWSTLGVFLVCGWAATALGVAVGLLQPDTRAARAFVIQSGTTGLYALTGAALYSPRLHWLTPLHLVSQAMLPATFFHLAWCFPVTRAFVERRPVLLLAPYLAALPLCIWFVAAFYATPPSAEPFYVVFSCVGVAIVALIAWPAYGYWEARTPLVRSQLRAVLPGIVLATAIALWLHLRAVLFGVEVPANLMATTVPIFYASVAYAIVRHDLFGIDVLLKQAAIYGVLTLAITGAYAGSLAVVTALAPQLATGPARVFNVLFVVVVAAAFEPARATVQRIIDRLFFRRRLDWRETVRTLADELTSRLDLDDILAQVSRAIRDGFQVERAVVLLWDDAAGGPVRAHAVDGVIGPGATLPALGALRDALRAGDVALWQARWSEASDEARDAVVGDLGRLGAALALPLRVGGTVIGAFAVGPRRSGRPFSREDLDLLRTLAAQAAIALSNARAYRALAELNAALESKVRDRTAELESSYAQLKAAQAQLVQSEKMASLGVLVAGVAHEINNPVSFIVNTMEPLRELVDELGDLARRHPDEPFADVLAEMRQALDVVGRGAERTASVVRDLRTFSRLGDTGWVPIDVEEHLDVTLKLLGSRLSGIAVVRDYGGPPHVDSAPGQLAQVFTNVIANACDALEGRGTIRIVTRQDGDAVVIVIEDDGPGMSDETRARIFDPFFTTKPQGKGTGLGLAISYGIVVAHHGTIEVDSAVGRGTRVTIRVPVRQRPAAATGT